MGGPVRRSLQRTLGEKLAEVSELVAALNIEISTLAGQCETAETEVERLKAWLCLCPDGMPADFNPDEQCPIHGDPDKAVTARALHSELAKYTGWEPTAKEEYEHACNLVEAAKGVVDAFDRGDKLRVNQFLADLKHALEM